MAFWVLFVAALVVRLGVGLAFGGLTAPETFEAHETANALLAGRGFVYISHGGVPHHSFYQPMYPWVAAAMYWLGGGSLLPLMLLQIVAGSLTAVIIARSGARLFSPAAGLAAGSLVALHPGLVVYSATKAHELAFDALAFSLVFWQWTRLSRDLTLRNAVWLGMLTGLSLLERPTALVFLPVGAAWLWWRLPTVDRAAVVRAVATATVIAAVVITPWTIRNFRVYDRLVFIRASDWEMFWRGNNPNASGSSLTPTGQAIVATLSPRDSAEFGRLTDENAQTEWFRRRAFAYIREHPGWFVERTLRKWFYFWWASPQTGYAYPPAWRYGYQTYYAAILAAALIGVWWVRRFGSRQARDAAWLLAGMFLALSLLQSLYYVDGRHRWGIEPMLLLFAGTGAAAVARVHAQ